MQEKMVLKRGAGQVYAHGLWALCLCVFLFPVYNTGLVLS